MKSVNENKGKKSVKKESVFWERAKYILVNTIIITILSTVLLKDCSAHDLISNKVMPALDSISKRQLISEQKQKEIFNKVSETSAILNKVKIDLDNIKEKYIHPEKQGIKCEVRQSRYLNDNEIGVYPDNEYKLKSGQRILVMNMNTASNPMLTFTVTTDVKVEDEEGRNHFFLNKGMLLQLGINTQKNKRGVYNLRFFNIE